MLQAFLEKKFNCSHASEIGSIDWNREGWILLGCDSASKGVALLRLQGDVPFGAGVSRLAERLGLTEIQRDSAGAESRCASGVAFFSPLPLRISQLRTASARADAAAVAATAIPRIVVVGRESSGLRQESSSYMFYCAQHDRIAPRGALSTVPADITHSVWSPSGDACALISKTGLMRLVTFIEDGSREETRLLFAEQQQRQEQRESPPTAAPTVTAAAWTTTDGILIASVSGDAASASVDLYDVRSRTWTPVQQHASSKHAVTRIHHARDRTVFVHGSAGFVTVLDTSAPGGRSLQLQFGEAVRLGASALAPAGDLLAVAIGGGYATTVFIVRIPDIRPRGQTVIDAKSLHPCVVKVPGEDRMASAVAFEPACDAALRLGIVVGSRLYITTLIRYHLLFAFMRGPRSTAVYWFRSPQRRYEHECAKQQGTFEPQMREGLVFWELPGDDSVPTLSSLGMCGRPPREGRSVVVSVPCRPLLLAASRHCAVALFPASANDNGHASGAAAAAAAAETASAVFVVVYDHCGKTIATRALPRDLQPAHLAVSNGGVVVVAGGASVWMWLTSGDDAERTVQFDVPLKDTDQGQPPAIQAIDIHGRNGGDGDNSRELIYLLVQPSNRLHMYEIPQAPAATMEPVHLMSCICDIAFRVVRMHVNANGKFLGVFASDDENAGDVMQIVAVPEIRNPKDRDQTDAVRCQVLQAQKGARCMTWHETDPLAFAVMIKNRLAEYRIVSAGSTIGDSSRWDQVAQGQARHDLPVCDSNVLVSYEHMRITGINLDELLLSSATAMSPSMHTNECFADEQAGIYPPERTFRMRRFNSTTESNALCDMRAVLAGADTTTGKALAALRQLNYVRAAMIETTGESDKDLEMTVESLHAHDRLALLVGELALNNYDFDTAEAALRLLSRSDATRDAAVRIAVSKYFAIKLHGLVADGK